MPGLEGTRLGRYLLLRRLGRGGMSEVYLAYDELMHREVAIKVVSSMHADYVERFRREAEAIDTLRHNHILPSYGYGEQGPWHYLVMPYIEHSTLQERLEQGPLSLEDAGELLQQIASGLQYAHDRGVIHRDIKPSNILLRDDHYAYLADFGLVKPVEGGGKLTQTGILLGTPEYMAPELADGAAGISSDIYALGILLYQMVTGRTPFTGDTPLAVYLKQMREQPIPPSLINPAIPHSIDQVILRALDKDPRRRYQSATELAQVYMQALATERARGSPVDQGGELRSFYETAEMDSEPLEERLLASEPTLRVQAPERPVSPTPVLPQAPEPTPVLPQQEPLVLPPYPTPATPARQAQQVYAPPGTARPARRTPLYPMQRPASARRMHREQNLVISLVIFLVLALFLGVIFYAAHSYSPGTQSRNTGVPAPAQSFPGNSQQATPNTNAIATAAASASAAAQVLATQQASNATAAAITGGTPLLTDPLSSNTNNRWPNDGVACAFTGGAYHVIVNKPDYLQPCLSSELAFGNAAIKVDVTLLQGSDAGLIFRANGDQFYDFEISNQGEFFFRRHDAGGGGNYTFLIQRTASNLVASGGQKNTLLVIASGSDFRLFINGTFVGEVQDSTYGSGQIGFVAGSAASDNRAEASFSNLSAFQVS